MDYGLLEIEGSEYKMEEPDKFEDSYFRKEYRQAYKTVNTIVNNMRERRTDATTQVQNVVPFIGKRGTGKTSAMLSFAKSLQDYHAALSKMEMDARRFQSDRPSGTSRFKMEGSGNEQPYYLFTSENGEILNVRFVCLDCIDGFLLEQEEDIFRIILGQMYARIEDSSRKSMKERGNLEYEMRDLQLRFDKVYRTVCQLGGAGKGNADYEESAITSLKSLTSSLTIKKEFAELVQQYLKVAAYVGEEYPTHVGRTPEQFLVITIDDLDMNIRSGFEMLGEINRYMMVNNVIVLLAADYDQLKILCEHEFYQMVPNFDLKLREKDSDVDTLARDYLDKVLPANDRICIPDLRKVPDVRMVVGNSGHMGLKQLIFAMLKQKVGLRMDTGGGKRHFYEQSSLRTFVNFYLMLHRMDSLETATGGERKISGGRNFLKTFERNYRVLMSDTVTRMVDERLDAHYKEVFQRITEISLPNSFRNLYFEILKNSGITEDSDGGKRQGNLASNRAYLPGLVDNLVYYGYSYGEVLRIIYCWGRESVQCKETIRCLIAFYTLELNRSYRHYCEAESRKEKDEERKRFIETMNGSIAGSWANKMFPKVSYRGREHMIGCRRDVDMRRVFLLEFNLEKIPIKDGKIILDEISGRNSYRESRGSKRRESQMETCRQMFRTILVLGMFFEQPRYKTDKIFLWSLEQTEFSGEESGLANEYTKSYGRISLRNSNGRSYFGLFNFVSNIFCYEENMKPLMDSLYACLFPETGDYEADGSLRERFFEELGIDREFDEWKENSHGFVLPIYNFDLMYNLMKRLRQREYFSESVDSNHVLEYLEKAIQFIIGKLSENDVFYKQAEDEMSKGEQTGRNEGTGTNYMEVFVSCPFVKWIRASEDGEGKRYLLPEFENIFSDMIEKLLNGDASSELQETPNMLDILGYDD